MAKPSPRDFRIKPLSKKNWSQFEKLFGERGACGGCWCMSFRLKKSVFEKQKGEGNKRAMKKLVSSGQPTGLLGIYKKETIGWLALAPREDFVKLENSRVHKRIDDRPVWSIPCFFIAKEFRRKGMSIALLKGAIQYAKKQKIKALEAYPTIPYSAKMPAAFAWIGILSSFEKSGFEIVDRTSKSRPMVRYYL